MSSFEDIETQNGRRHRPREAQQCKACVVARPGFWVCPSGSEEAHRGPHAADFAWTLDRASGEWLRFVAREIYGIVPRFKAPRSALGFGLLGPVAPPAFKVSVRLTSPGARTYDPSSLRLTMPDGTVFTGDALYVERDT